LRSSAEHRVTNPSTKINNQDKGFFLGLPFSLNECMITSKNMFVPPCLADNTRLVEVEEEGKKLTSHGTTIAKVKHGRIKGVSERKNASTRDTKTVLHDRMDKDTRLLTNDADEQQRPPNSCVDDNPQLFEWKAS
jgi:hypothetical protein